MRLATVLVVLPLCQFLHGQTTVEISNVRVIEMGKSSAGAHLTLDPHGQINNAEGADRAVIYEQDDVRVNLWCKVSTHHSRRSSLKDSAVNLIFEIAVIAGKRSDNRRVEKIFYKDQDRKSTIIQRFNFKSGITMRVITLEFDAEIK